MMDAAEIRVRAAESNLAAVELELGLTDTLLGLLTMSRSLPDADRMAWLKEGVRRLEDEMENISSKKTGLQVLCEEHVQKSASQWRQKIEGR